MQQTIAAHSGGALPAAIGICRVSGPQAFAVADQLFRPKKGGPLSAGPFSTMRYGDVLDTDGRALDICLACCYKGPASYTGEDLLPRFPGHRGRHFGPGLPAGGPAGPGR